MMKHNPTINHEVLQPCSMIEAMAPAASSGSVLAKPSLDFVTDSIKTLFGPDLSKRTDLCFGGIAPWEKQ